MIELLILVIYFVIKSFTDKQSEKVFSGIFSMKFPAEIQARANMKLVTLHNASELEQLRIPASNRLELLKGNLKAFHSIRINNQWRIIFKWENGDASAVQIIDYH